MLRHLTIPAYEHNRNLQRKRLGHCGFGRTGGQAKCADFKEAMQPPEIARQTDSRNGLGTLQTTPLLFMKCSRFAPSENFGVFQTEVFRHSSSMEQGTSGLGRLDRTAAGKAPIPGDLLVRQFPAAA